jgi:cytochrome d ubiquinol oxidase subunit II
VCIIFGSVVPALLWGVAFANILRGVPIDADGNFTGNLFTLLNPFGLLGGLATVALFCTYGAIFVALKTLGPIRQEARRVAGRVGVGAVVLGAVFLVWSLLVHGDAGSWALGILPAVRLVAGLAANAREREGWAFALVGAAVVGLVATLFVALFPDVMPSSTDPAFSLTVENASSTPRTLAVMSWVALATLPFVLAYQAWTYWVFRKRIGRHSIPTQIPHGADALGR